MKQQAYVVVLNDQGGAVMNVTHDKTNTLRAQDHGHPPLIIIRKEHEDSNRTGLVQSSGNRTEDDDSPGIGLQGSSGNTGTWSVDEKWGLSLYVYYEQANTLAHRDYKQPQAVVVKR